MKQEVYLHILNEAQQELLPVIREFFSDYYLVGGTAIALQIGHRESIDFDLFTYKEKNNLSAKAKLEKLTNHKVNSIFEGKDQSHFVVNGVKITFFNYYYRVPVKKHPENLKMPDLLTLACMKAFALGGRAKWKDYVDLYFLLHHSIKLDKIITGAKKYFNTNNSVLFNERNFIEQLTFYKDLDYGEKVYYTGKLQPTEDEIKSFLTEIAIDYLKNKGLR